MVYLLQQYKLTKTLTCTYFLRWESIFDIYISFVSKKNSSSHNVLLTAMHHLKYKNVDEIVILKCWKRVNVDVGCFILYANLF